MLLYIFQENLVGLAGGGDVALELVDLGVEALLGLLLELLDLGLEVLLLPFGGGGPLGGLGVEGDRSGGGPVVVSKLGLEMERDLGDSTKKNGVRKIFRVV